MYNESTNVRNTVQPENNSILLYKTQQWCQHCRKRCRHPKKIIPVYHLELKRRVFLNTSSNSNSLLGRKNNKSLPTTIVAKLEYIFASSIFFQCYLKALKKPQFINYHVSQLLLVPTNVRNGIQPQHTSMLRFKPKQCCQHCREPF